MLRTLATLLLASSALTFVATAQAQNAPAAQSTAQPASSADPTIKDRVDQVVSTLLADPLRKADTDMKHVLDALAGLNPKPIEKLSAVEARQQPTAADGVKALKTKEGKSTAAEGGVTVRDLTYNVAGGGTLPVRVYAPENAQGGSLPVIVYYHGGGWVIADIDVYDSTPRAMAKMVGAIVVSVEYRKAPENKFPVMFDDAWAGYQWTLENAKSWGGDPARIAVMGESAGGGLALSVAIMARDKNIQQPRAQVLVYPVAGVDTDTPSYKENSNAKPLNKPMMEWFIANVIRSDADKEDPRLDAIGKANVRGLSPTTIITAQIDPLRSDGERLADKLRQAGVEVIARNYEGVTHEFFGMGDVVAKAKDAEMFAAGQLKGALDRDAAGAGRSTSR